MLRLKNYINRENQRVWQPREIDVAKFPKAVAYLQKVTAKYSDVLTGIPIYISNYPDMKATATEIYIGQFWIDELEKENVKMQQLVEWTILHEAYHVNHRHLEKYMSIYFGAYALIFAGALYTLAFHSTEIFAGLSLQVKFLVSFATMYFALQVPHVLKIAYSRFIMEPQADNFANKMCRCKDAFSVAKVFIANSPQDLLHPSHKSRLAKMDKVLQIRDFIE